MSPVRAKVEYPQSSYNLANSPLLFWSWIYGGLPMTISKPSATPNIHSESKNELVSFWSYGFHFANCFASSWAKPLSSDSRLISFPRNSSSSFLKRYLVDADLAEKCLCLISANFLFVCSISRFSKRFPCRSLFFFVISVLADTNFVSRFGSVGMPKLGFDASFSQSHINEIKKRSFVICAAMLCMSLP